MGQIKVMWVAWLDEKKVFLGTAGDQSEKTPVIDPFPPVNPQSGQFGEDVDDAEGFEVVDEDVGHPQAVDQLKVHCRVKSVLTLKDDVHPMIRSYKNGDTLY